MEVSDHPHALATFPPGKENPVKTEWEAGRALQPVWTFCRRGKSPATVGIHLDDSKWQKWRFSWQ